MRFITFSLLFIISFFLFACDMQKYPEPKSDNKREILIYSGMTMLQPLREISGLVEAEENCRVIITSGASGHILKSVEVNQVGDLFFPGDDSYIMILEKQEIVTESVRVGYNQAGLFVQLGNPKQISSDLKNLQNKHLNVVIGTQKAGAIGRETERILRQTGIYQEVVNNSLYMTTDSKGLANAIRNKSADLVVNWKATNYLPENVGQMNFLPLSGEIVDRQPLVMGLLTYSQHPDLARKIMELAISDVGRDIFRKYGFLD